MYNENKSEMNNNHFIENLKNQLIKPETTLADLPVKQQFEIIRSKAAIHSEAIIPKHGQRGELLELLEHSKETGKPLNIKFGIDPTGPDIHMGHAISLLMLRRFQWMGHHIELVVGDFTAGIGDPSGKTSERKVITDRDIKKNMSTYISQLSRILDMDQKLKVKVSYNSEWLSDMTMKKWMPILHKISGNQLFNREDFSKRLKSGGMVSAAEILYPLFMAYDSVVTKPDIELGGVDQLLNLHWCRELMQLNDQPKEMFILVDLLPGTSGEKDSENQFVKMSKSKNNYIMINEEPREIYGKVMSIPDKIMWIWFRELTEITTQDLETLKDLVDREEFHPMEAKRLLARAIVGTFNHYNKDTINSAENSFNQKFGKERILIPDDTEKIETPSGKRLIDALSEATGESKTNLKKMVNQKKGSGIKILEGEQFENASVEDLVGKTITKKEDTIARVGKRRFFKFIAK